MTTSVVSRNERNSLSLAISYARSQTIKGDGIAAREDVARRIWNETYQVVPALSYAQKERPLRNQLTTRWNNQKLPIVQGNPDPAKGLLEYLIRQGLPDCLAIARITHAALWTLRDLNILVPQARQDADYLLYEQQPPRMEFPDRATEERWYKENIIYRYSDKEKDEEGNPRVVGTKISPEVEERRKLSVTKRPNIGHYLWKFDQNAWQKQAENYEARFFDRMPLLVANLEQALRQR